MVSIFESVTPTVAPPLVVDELKDIHKVIKEHRSYLLQIDEAGGHRFE